MSDKLECVYSLREWEERAHVHYGVSSAPFREEWKAAGSLAADVLGWPSKPPAVQPWAHRSTILWRLLQRVRLGATTDEERLRTALALKDPLSRAEQEWLTHARAFGELSVFEELTMREQLQRLQKLLRVPDPPTLTKDVIGWPLQRPPFDSWHRNWLVLQPGAIEGYALGLKEDRGRRARRRDEHHFYTNPAAAVYLSAAAGLARETLRLCEECARFVAFPRVGFSQRYCPACQELRGQRNRSLRASRSTSHKRQQKWERWKLVSGRVYRHMLREDHKKRNACKGPMSPEAKTKWEEWRLLQWNALLGTQDLDTWEHTAAPILKPGPKPEAQ